jgi:hypothetical protein
MICGNCEHEIDETKLLCQHCGRVTSDKDVKNITVKLNGFEIDVYFTLDDDELNIELTKSNTMD